MLKKLIQATLLQLLFSFSGFILPDDDIEEVVITGSYIGDEGANLTPTEIIQKEDYLNLNITNIAEISKYLSSASGSNFQANTLGALIKACLQLHCVGWIKLQRSCCLIQKDIPMLAHLQTMVRDT